MAEIIEGDIRINPVTKQVETLTPEGIWSASAMEQQIGEIGKEVGLLTDKTAQEAITKDVADLTALTAPKEEIKIEPTKIEQPKEEIPTIPKEVMDEEMPKTETDLQIEKLTQQTQEYDQQINTYIENLDSYRSTINEESRAMIESIKQSFEARKNEQREINRRLEAATRTATIRWGGRYTPLLAEGIVSAQENAGLRELERISALENQAVQEALRARRIEDFELLHKKMELVRSERDRKDKIISDLSKLSAERNEEIVKKKEKIINQSRVIDLVGQGLSRNNIISKLSGIVDLKEIDEAMDVILESSIATKGEIIDKFTDEKGDRINVFLDKNTGEIKQVKVGKEKIEGVAGGAVSGVAERDAQSIMSGNLSLNDLPTKDNYRATVSAIVANKKAEALKSGDIYGIMAASAGGKNISDTQILAMQKAVNVVGQISDLKSLFQDESALKEKTGVDINPIIAIFRSNNPYDTKAQAIKAQLSSIVPNLARGVYGEVGVLTDNDIKVYSRTLPNLANTEDVRNMVLGLTIKSIQRSIENSIKVNASAGRDVSGFKDIYTQVKEASDSLIGNPDYSQLKSQLIGGEILVIDKKSGEIGAIAEGEFDNNLYEELK